MTTLNENSTAAPLASEQAQRTVSAWIRPLEVTSALLMLAIFGMLLAGVISRYVLSKPIIWIDEAVSISFLWLAMLGSALAMHRNEHLRLTLFVERMPERLRSYVQALSLVAVAAFLLALLHPAMEYAQEEWFISTPALIISSTR